MTHQEVIEQMAVEHYLLGELTSEARARFEEHLFDCQECTADLKQGVLFLEGAKAELKDPPHLRAVPASSPRSPSPLAWLWQARFLAPALAACLAMIVYQSAVLLPRLRTEVAESRAPSVIEPLVLANAGARGSASSGGAISEIQVPRHGFYALSVDIPPAANATAYRCSLYSPAGGLIWQVDVSPRQAHDAVTIQVPATTAQEGTNELRVQSVSSGSTAKDSLVLLASYRYKLTFAN